jgi:hypothetical protein
MTIARRWATRWLWLGLLLLVACYERVVTPEQAAAPSDRLGGSAGGTATNAAAASGTRTPVDRSGSARDGGAGRGADASMSPARAGEHPTTPPPQPGPVDAGTGGCGAFLAPGQHSSPDASAFANVGGIGFSFIGVCDRCGWSQDSEACQALVYSVPTIDDPDYSACLEISGKWMDCLHSMACICSGEVPEGCRDTKAKLDSCLAADAGI